MSDDLRTLLTRAVDGEARRFDAQHQGEETSLYERAITPRRRARRVVEAGGALAVVAILAVGAYALTHAPAALDPAVPTASPSAAAEAREITAPGGTFDSSAEAPTLAEAAGMVLLEVPACAELDALSRLDGQTDLGGEAVPLGGIVDSDGGVNGAHARTFRSESDAADFLSAVIDAATACRDGAAGEGFDVRIADVGLVAIAGDGVRVEVDTGDGTGTWKARVHVQGVEALAVVVAPGATDLAASIVLERFAGGA